MPLLWKLVMLVWLGSAHSFSPTRPSKSSWSRSRGVPPGPSFVCLHRVEMQARQSMLKKQTNYINWNNFVLFTREFLIQVMFFFSFFYNELSLKHSLIVITLLHIRKHLCSHSKFTHAYISANKSIYIRTYISNCWYYGFISAYFLLISVLIYTVHDQIANISSFITLFKGTDPSSNLVSILKTNHCLTTFCTFLCKKLALSFCGLIVQVVFVFY